MSRIQLKFAELHAPLFLFGDKGGKNLGYKLDVSKIKGLVLEYDREEKELHVTWEGMTSFTPATNIVSMVEGQAGPAPKLVGDTTQRVIPQSAQVSTPFGHVHAGPGQGQTGQESWVKKVGPEDARARAEVTETVMVKRGPGRPPKERA